MPEHSHSIEILPRRVTVILAITVAAVAAVGVTGQIVKYQTGHTNVFGIVPQFYLDDENNVPTYLASLLLLIAAGLLAVIASSKHRIGDEFRWHWTVLSALFLLMSLDETASFHERLIRPTRALLGVEGWLYFAWVVPGALFVLVVGLGYLRFFLHLEKPFKLLFAMAGIVYVGAALGIETVGAARADAVGQDNLPYALIASTEEVLEMAAVVLFIHALLVYMSRHVDSVRFRIGAR